MWIPLGKPRIIHAKRSNARSSVLIGFFKEMQLYDDIQLLLQSETNHCLIWVSYLSTFDGTVWVYHGFHG
jgi:hypothetical protein